MEHSRRHLRVAASTRRYSTPRARVHAQRRSRAGRVAKDVGGNDGLRFHCRHRKRREGEIGAEGQGGDVIALDSRCRDQTDRDGRDPAPRAGRLGQDQLPDGQIARSPGASFATAGRRKPRRQRAGAHNSTGHLSAASQSERRSEGSPEPQLQLAATGRRDVLRATRHPVIDATIERGRRGHAATRRIARQSADPRPSGVGSTAASPKTTSAFPAGSAAAVQTVTAAGADHRDGDRADPLDAPKPGRARHAIAIPRSGDEEASRCSAYARRFAER